MTWLRTRRRAPPRRQRQSVCRAKTGQAVARPMHRRHRGQRGGWWLLSPSRPSICEFRKWSIVIITTEHTPLLTMPATLTSKSSSPRLGHPPANSGSSKAAVLGLKFLGHSDASPSAQRYEKKRGTKCQWEVRRSDLAVFLQRFATEPLKLRRGPPWLLSGSSGPAIRPVEGNWCRCHIASRQFFLGEMIMVEPGSPLLAFSDHAAEL